jgi:hypothetical protein
MEKFRRGSRSYHVPETPRLERRTRFRVSSLSVQWSYSPDPERVEDPKEIEEMIRDCNSGRYSQKNLNGRIIKVGLSSIPLPDEIEDLHWEDFERLSRRCEIRKTTIYEGLED